MSGTQGPASGVTRLAVFAQPLTLQWLVLTAAVLFAAVVLWQHGALALLFDADPSGISIAIVGLYAIASVHAGTRVLWLAGEHLAARRLGELLAGQPAQALQLDPQGRLLIGTAVAADGVLARYTGRLLRLPPAQRAAHTTLYDALEKRLLGNHQLGWLLADLMIKLGLLGTVIGFIAMLGAITSLGALDVGAMQSLLLDMSAGMRIALFTTLSGLGAGLLLGLQYHIVERGADELLVVVSETVATGVLPRLEQ